MTEHSQEARKNIAHGRKRRFAIGSNTLLSIVLAAVVLGMVNYIGSRHYRRVDWTDAQIYSLSGRTKGLLDSLTNTIDVIVFFESQEAAFTDVQNLLKEYQAYSKHIKVTQIDPDRDLARSQEMRQKYDVTEPNVVVFDHAGRSKYLTDDDIMLYDYRPMQKGQLPTKLAFKGEQAFSSAIQSVTESHVPHVYFLQGHGERNPDSFDEHMGFSSVAKAMRRDNMQVSSLVLGERQEIPRDCDALVIAGPTKRLSQPEVDLIRAYMEKSGRLLVALDPLEQVGLSPLLEDWGVSLKQDIVVDATRTLTGRELFVTGKDYGEHAITEKLRDATTILYLPRSVQPLQADEQDVSTADKPHVFVLASCSDHGWAEMDIAESPMKYDVSRDQPGPIPVAVAVEKGPTLGIDVDIKPTRMVVFGDSDFVSNGALNGGNADFYMSSLNWLLEREELLAIAYKPMGQQRLVMTSVDIKRVGWIVIGGIPGVVALLGCIVWLQRRS